MLSAQSGNGFIMQGMNWIDLAYLQCKNISNHGSRITYFRQKTGKSFNIQMTDKLMEIINRLKPVDHSNPEDFVFPVLDPDIEKSFYHKRIVLFRWICLPVELLKPDRKK